MANFHVVAGRDAAPAHLTIRKIQSSDLRDALRNGVDDFLAKPSHLAFIGMLYPIFGICLAALTFSQNGLPLVYPLASGFALVGPVAAVGLYEISRRRELGLDTSWTHAFEVLRSPSMPSIVALGLVLMVIFLAWLMTAQALYEWLYGPLAPASYPAFLYDVLTTSRGWTLILVGNFVGFLFAAVVLTISAVSFPLLVDRDVGVAVAVQTSVRAVMTNLRAMALWGLVVAGALVVGSLPLFVGLVVVMPILGHATWHLYRRVIEP